MAKRVRLAVLMTATFVAGAAWNLAHGPFGSIDAAEPLLASDAGTWQKLLSEKDAQDILKTQGERIKLIVRSQGTFNQGKAKLRWMAHLIAGVANATVLRGGESAGKAAALRAAALELAAAAKGSKFDAAKSAFEKVQSYPATIEPAADAKPAPWAEVLPLDMLMKGVSSIDSASGSANRKDDKTFKKSAKDLGADSKLLACLAVVAREHNPNNDWKGWCDEMRDGSVALAKEFDAKDQAGAKKAHNDLQKSCTACHDVYRKDE